jgi:exosortase/archaeosortase
MVVFLSAVWSAVVKVLVAVSWLSPRFCRIGHPSGLSRLWSRCLAEWFIVIRYYIKACLFLKEVQICLLTAVWLAPSGSSTVHIYSQTIHRTTQLTTLVGRLSGIRTQNGQTKINDELTA